MRVDKEYNTYLQKEGEIQSQMHYEKMKAQYDYDQYLKTEGIAIAKQQRQSLMQTSISMFVLNISMSQLVSSIKPLVKGNEFLTQSLDTVQASLSLCLAPMQAYYSMLMIIQASQGKTALTAIYMGIAFAAAFFLLLGFQQKSPGIRAALFALSGAMMAVAITSWGAATGIGVFKTAWGDWSTMAALVIAAGALAAAVGYMTAAPKAQTLTGHRKRVRKGGMAELDDDEVVQRVSKDGSKNGGGGNINIYLPEGYNGSMADAKITAHSVKRMMNSGYSSVKYTRKVVTGG
jgi:hypothetical protein